MYDEIYKEIKLNFNKYNISNIAFSDSDIRNILFSRFYRQISEASHIDPVLISSIEKIIYHLCELLYSWDDLIDEHGMDVTESYNMVKDKITPEKFEIKNDLHKLCLPEEFFYKLCITSMNNIKDYFLLEKVAIEKTPPIELILTLIDKGNCDFEFYNQILFEILDKDNIKSLKEFFTHYLLADLIADHITDLEDDIKKSSYNPVILFYQLCLSDEYSNLSYGHVLKKLHESEDGYLDLYNQEVPEKFSGNLHRNMFDYFISLSDNHINLARTKLEFIRQEELKSLLSLYLEGLSAGINIFKKYDYLYWMDREIRCLYKTFLLKPHPWERISEDDLGRYR